MRKQLITCDACGKPIKDDEPFTSISIQHTTKEGELPEMTSEVWEFHDEHAPVQSTLVPGQMLFEGEIFEDMKPVGKAKPPPPAKPEKVKP